MLSNILLNKYNHLIRLADVITDELIVHSRTVITIMQLSIVSVTIILWLHDIQWLHP